MEEKNKKGYASWHNPTLGCECPHCGQWDDYYKQWIDNEYPFPPLQSSTEEELKNIFWTCPSCKKEFEMEAVEW